MVKTYLDLEALSVKTGRASFAADEAATFRADETPVGVGVRQVLGLLARLRCYKMLRAHDLCGRDLDGTCSKQKILPANNC